MFGKVVLWSLAFLAFISFNFGNSGGIPPDRITELYRRSDSLYRLSNSTPVTDSLAFTGFKRVIAEIEGARDFVDKDRILFRAYLQKGVLLDVKNDYAGARQAYCKALSLPVSTDSLSFVASVYAGATYYNLNNFDSASYLLLRAESLIARGDKGNGQGTEDEVRLYNTLGVLYYDNGNYRQGKNYFNRALEIVQSKHPMDTISAVGLETNIATSLYRLGLYQESLSIYHKIINYRLGTNYIYMNMGRTYAALDEYREALACFKKVDASRVPAVLNEKAAAYLQLHRPDSCAMFLDQLGAAKNTVRPNDLDIGINALYRADLLAGQRQYRASLMSLQKAIILFSGNFRDESIYSNPSGFTGTFAYYRLFDALNKKAAVFERLYREQPESTYLSAAYEAYKAALAMLRYIEKSYDTDDAKIFLKKSSGQVYQGALSVCLELNRLHPGDHYTEQAFMISERNKASIIGAGLKERTFTHLAGGTEELLQKERNIKYNIARLNVRSDEAQGGKEFEALAREKTGYEIELSHLQKDLEQNSAYYQLKYNDSSPGIPELQRHLGPHQALISFFTTAEALHVFMLTPSSFAYARIDSLSALQKDIGDWLHVLQTAESGKKFRGEAIGKRLYRRLVRPIQESVSQQQEWIIIPDGMLCYLPFESLPSEEGDETSGGGGEASAGGGSHTLLETTTISYQFSSRFIVDPPDADQQELSAYQVLAFAPFAGDGGSFDRSDEAFSRLPASREEIEGLPGGRYMDSMATKERFLEEMNKYPVIHLATHAVSSIDNASESFIAFYPQKRSRAEDCLFLEELYGLNMNATKLVIISACETGQGELVSNEGVISLARAFAYAGCGSTICSLWKADDKATSFILSHFHVYLRQGYTKSKALQQAKLDYLGSDALNKSPAYWSHLVLIGNTGPICEAGHPYRWIMLLILVAGVVFFLVYRRRFFRRIGSPANQDIDS